MSSAGLRVVGPRRVNPKCSLVWASCKPKLTPAGLCTGVVTSVTSKNLGSGIQFSA